MSDPDSLLKEEQESSASEGERVEVRERPLMDEKIKTFFTRLRLRRKARYDVNSISQDEAAPKDLYHLVYICMLMTGVGFLIPWTCFIGAVDYFFYYYLREFPSVSVLLPMSYLMVTFFAVTLNLGLVKVVAVHNRISFGYVVFVVSLLLIPLLDIGIYNCTISTSVSFFLTLFCVGLVGLGSGVQQSSLYGLASMLPKKYVQAVMAGESVAGVLEITLRIITKGTVKSVRTGAFLFFSISLGIILLCILCHCYIRRNKMVVYYMRQCQAKPEPLEQSHGEEDEVMSSSEENVDQQLLLSKSQETEMDELSSQQEQEGDGVVETNGDVLVNRSVVRAQESRHKNRFLRTLMVYLNVVTQIWPLISAIFIAYIVTLLLFPGLISEIQNCTLGTWTPILLIAIFNYTDFVAKYIALIPLRLSPKMLLVGSSVRIVLIPLIILCVSPSPSNPVFGSSTAVWAGLFVLLLGLSNGYFGSLPLINVSKHVKNNKDRELAGIIMTWALMCGLLAGGVLAYALTPLTTIEDLVLCTNNATTQYFNLCGHENDTSILT